MMRCVRVSFTLDVVELSVGHDATTPGSVGFTVNALSGERVPNISAASGLFRDTATGGASAGFDLKQAFVSWKPSAAWKIDAGKFTTHVGAEVIEGADGANDTYSRGLLFGFAEPFTHTGVRAAWTVNDHVTATMLVVQGWDNVRDNNSGKSFGGQVAWTMSPALTVTANYLGGPERANTSDWRHLYNVVAVAHWRERVTVTMSGDLGRETGAADGATAMWQGVSTSARMAIDDRNAVAARIEWFNDRDGVRTGTPMHVTSWTLAPTHTFTPHVTVRAEGRFDQASAAVFGSSTRPSTRQFTTALNLLLGF